MDRRELLVGAGAWVAAVRVGHAQPAVQPRRIGFLSLDTADSEAGRLAQTVFPDALERLGYTARGNLVIEWRWADGKPASLPELAAELVRSRVEIIVARNTASVQAAMNATRTVPIVMLNGNFPVEAGLVKSLARPGGNVTGTSYWVSTEVFGKHFQILKELAPRTDRVAALGNTSYLGPALYQAVVDAHKRAAERLGMTVQHFEVSRPQDVGAALAAIAASGIKAMFYSGDPVVRARTADVMAFLQDQRMASIAPIPTFAEGGGLAHYAPDGRDFYDRTAGYVDRILKGAQPSNLPVEEPTKFEFAINLKTARAIGLRIPHPVLLRADKVIE